MSVDLVTTVLIPAASYNLVDLATVRAELGIKPADTSSDDWLSTQAIPQVSRGIANYCNRVFPVEQIEDQADIRRDPYPYQVPGGVRVLQLSRWPLAKWKVLALAAPAAQGDTVLSLAGAELSGIVSGPGLAPGTIAAISGNDATISPAVAAAMPAGTPIAFGIAVKQTLGINNGAPSEQGLTANRDYRIDAAVGQLLRLDPFAGTATDWEAVPTTITYSAGYDPIPDDVILAAVRWCAIRNSERSRDPLLKSIEQPGIGTETYWVGGPPGTGGLPQAVANLLDNYRTPVAI